MQALWRDVLDVSQGEFKRIKMQSSDRLQIATSAMPAAPPDRLSSPDARQF